MKNKKKLEVDGTSDKNIDEEIIVFLKSFFFLMGVSLSDDSDSSSYLSASFQDLKEDFSVSQILKELTNATFFSKNRHIFSESFLEFMSKWTKVLKNAFPKIIFLSNSNPINNSCLSKNSFKYFIRFLNLLEPFFKKQLRIFVHTIRIVLTKYLNIMGDMISRKMKNDKIKNVLPNADTFLAKHSEVFMNSKDLATRILLFADCCIVEEALNFLKDIKDSLYNHYYSVYDEIITPELNLLTIKYKECKSLKSDELIELIKEAADNWFTYENYKKITRDESQYSVILNASHKLFTHISWYLGFNYWDEEKLLPVKNSTESSWCAIEYEDLTQEVTKLSNINSESEFSKAFEGFFKSHDKIFKKILPNIGKEQNDNLDETSNFPRQNLLRMFFKSEPILAKHFVYSFFENFGFKMISFLTKYWIENCITVPEPSEIGFVKRFLLLMNSTDRAKEAIKYCIYMINLHDSRFLHDFLVENLYQFSLPALAKDTSKLLKTTLSELERRQKGDILNNCRDLLIEKKDNFKSTKKMKDVFMSSGNSNNSDLYDIWTFHLFKSLAFAMNSSCLKIDRSNNHLVDGFNFKTGKLLFTIKIPQLNRSELTKEITDLNKIYQCEPENFSKFEKAFFEKWEDTLDFIFPILTSDKDMLEKTSVIHPYYFLEFLRTNCIMVKLYKKWIKEITLPFINLMVFFHENKDDNTGPDEKRSSWILRIIILSKKCRISFFSTNQIKRIKSALVTKDEVILNLILSTKT